MSESTENLLTCPACQSMMDTTGLEPLSRVACPSCGTAIVISPYIAHYELIEVVGRGGMGVVYKAKDTSLDRYVALKVLRKDHSANAELVAQLETEAAITASINHPHVVRVFTTGTDLGRFYIAMELVDKGTLDDLINLQGQVAEAQVLEIAIQIAQGLRAAYQHGLIHRDVKPGNILFADSHTAKIVDFGLAMLEAAAEGGGEIWGTPYYVAPEKLDQKPEDIRSDMYSLGATLFHALAGRPPFEAEDATMVALKHLKSQAVSLQAFAPHVTGSTAYVINRTLLKDPDQRYQSYDEFIEHLEYARAELEQKSSQPQLKKRVVLETEEDQKLWSYVTFGMLGLAVLLGVGGWWYFAGAGKSTPTASSAPSTVQAVSSGASKRQVQQYENARQQLLDGKWNEAAKDFHALAADANTPSPMAQWSLLHEGLSELLAGRTDEARKAFASLQTRTMPAKTADDQALASFFQELAGMMADEQPTPATAAKDFGKDNFAAFAPLVLGIKDWQLAQFDEAGVLLRQFQSASPKGEFAWIGEYKDLVGDYLSDFTEYRGALELVKMANTPEATRQMADRLQKTSETLRTKGKLSERLVQLSKELQGEEEKRQQEAAEKIAVERAGVEATLPRVAELAQAWKFTEARQQLYSAKVNLDEVRRERRSVAAKLDWLTGWKNALIEDFSKPNSKITLQRKDGSELKGAITKATPDGVEFKGTGVVAWNELSPESLIKAALAVAPADAATERSWQAGVFAAMNGQTAEAEKLLLGVSANNPTYASALPIVFPSARATKENLAKNAKLTANSFVQAPEGNDDPSKAVDDNPKTRWFAKEGKPKWLQVDFGEPKTISRWVVTHTHVFGDPVEWNTSEFELQASADAKNWQTVDKVTDNTADVTRRMILPVKTRYARLLIVKASSRKDVQAARIPEFALNGPDTKDSEDLAKSFFELTSWSGAPHLVSQDIGTAKPGDTVVDEEVGEYILRGAGEDIWMREDSFRFAHQKLQGDGQIVARIRSIDNTDEWAKAGLMFRESLDTNSKNVFAALTPGARATLQNRPTAGSETQSVHETGKATPYWVKLVRRGDKFTMSISPDGSKWQEFRSVTQAMPAELYVGLAITAHNKNSSVCGARFDFLQISANHQSAAKTTSAGASSGNTAQNQKAAARSTPTP